MGDLVIGTDNVVQQHSIMLSALDYALQRAVAVGDPQLYHSSSEKRGWMIYFLDRWCRYLDRRIQVCNGDTLLAHLRLDYETWPTLVCQQTVLSREEVAQSNRQHHMRRSEGTAHRGGGCVVDPCDYIIQDTALALGGIYHCIYCARCDGTYRNAVGRMIVGRTHSTSTDLINSEVEQFEQWARDGCDVYLENTLFKTRLSDHEFLFRGWRVCTSSCQDEEDGIISGMGKLHRQQKKLRRKGQTQRGTLGVHMIG